MRGAFASGGVRDVSVDVARGRGDTKIRLDLVPQIEEASTVGMKRVRLLTTAILGAFANMVYANRSRLYRLWLVAPWIGDDDGMRGAMALLLEALRHRSATVIIITRPPQTPWHMRAVDVLRSEARATIYTCPNLHTKLYIAECNGFRGAVLGSPNLTPRADKKNLELAVEFRTTSESADDDDVAALVSELSRYAGDLRQNEDVTLL